MTDEKTVAEKLALQQAASDAARALGMIRKAKAKPGEFAAMGKKGAAAFWAKYRDNPRMKKIEMRRRAAIRRTKRRARIARAIAGQK